MNTDCAILKTLSTVWAVMEISETVAEIQESLWGLFPLRSKRRKQESPFALYVMSLLSEILMRQHLRFVFTMGNDKTLLKNPTSLKTHSCVQKYLDVSQKKEIKLETLPLKKANTTKPWQNNSSTWPWKILIICIYWNHIHINYNQPFKNSNEHAYCVFPKDGRWDKLLVLSFR